MQLKGKVKRIGETEQVSEKFKKRELVITTEENPQYPQHISIQATQDKVVMFDNLLPGDEVTAHINIRGKEYEKDGVVKYFNTLECWSLKTD